MNASDVDTDADDLRAQAAYRKAGFRVEGLLRHAWFQDGRYVDDIRMALLRDEWVALPRPRSWDLTAAAMEARADGDSPNGLVRDPAPPR